MTSNPGQPILFDPIPEDAHRFAVLAFERFRPEMEKLKATLSPSGYDWWRSRWYEWIGFVHSEPHEVWKEKYDLNMAFEDVWAIFKDELNKH